MLKQRLKKEEVYELQRTAREIRRLAKMETCGFRDKETVNVQKDLRLWLMWFEVEAQKIEKIVGEYAE
jgi:hypothetical protein